MYAMRRHKAWRGGSNAQHSCVPATAIRSTFERIKIKVWRSGRGPGAVLGRFIDASGGLLKALESLWSF